jgi:hypothetical protein
MLCSGLWSASRVRLGTSGKLEDWIWGRLSIYRRTHVIRNMFAVGFAFSLGLAFLRLYAPVTHVGAETATLHVDDVLKLESLRPKGKWYNAKVPDRLDLAERANFSINALIGNLEPSQL